MNEQERDTHVAIHEAGHVVADYRLWGDEHQGYGRVTINPDLERGIDGHAKGPCAERCFNADDAAKVMLSSLAGYGALVVAGQNEQSAIRGCESDLNEAEELIESWSLESVESWKRQAVDLMSKPENRNAVELVARWLIENRTLDAELAHILIDVADGEITEDDLRRYLTVRLGYQPSRIPRFPS